MELEELRSQIDLADKELLDAFSKRMSISEQIGQVKKGMSKPILDASREREKLASIYDMANEKDKPYVLPLYSLLFELSRAAQCKNNSQLESKYNVIDKIIKEYEGKAFPSRAIVACQGIEGAFSQEACEKMFEIPSIMFVNSFSKVFASIDAGLCEYGIIPVENSTAGTVTNIYDLMIKHSFSIVRSIRVKVSHNCLVMPGTKLSDIKEIVSHEHAINQCPDFIKSLGNDVKVTYCSNTAVAAKMVADSGRKDLAAISSGTCASVYGLEIAKADVHDNGNNYTRFICIARRPEIYPGADRTSIMMTLKHKPGTLYKVLALLYARGINLVKLESRPLPDKDFEFMFYFDLDTSVYSSGFSELLGELDNMSEEFRYLGSYSEIV